MIWLTWRQFRAPALVLLAALATAVVALAITGPQLSDLLQETGQTFFAALAVDRVKTTTFVAGTALVYAMGIVPVGMAVLALAIGVTVGMLLRRTVAAMAVTMVLVVAVQILMPQVVQAHLLSPKHIVTSITSDNMQEVSASATPGSRNDVIIERIAIGVDLPGAWIIQNRTYDAAGQVVDTFPAWGTDCAPPPGTPVSGAGRQACFDRLKTEGYVQRVDYQPTSRFWPMQLIETGILLGLAVLLSGFCLWRLRRDLT